MPNPIISSLTIPVLKNGTVTNKTYDLPAGGSGSGDMQASVYDPDGDVATAGGIPSYATHALSEKTDKVRGATNGNFAGLDANGNLTDSGKSSSNFRTAPTIKTSVISYGSVTFTNMPSSGNNIIEFFTSTPGADYTAISTSGTSVTLTYDTTYNGATVYCLITEVG